MLRVRHILRNYAYGMNTGAYMGVYLFVRLFVDIGLDIGAQMWRCERGCACG